MKNIRILFSFFVISLFAVVTFEIFAQSKLLQNSSVTPHSVPVDRCRKDVPKENIALTSIPGKTLMDALIYINGQMVFAPVYDNIFRTDSNYRVSSRVLKSWHASSDYKRYTFVINSGMKFSNGKDLTIETLIKTLDPNVKSQYTSIAVKRMIKSLNKIDQSTLEIVLKRPYQMFPELLSDFQTILVHESELGKRWPAGSGPFSVCRQTSSEVIIERREMMNGKRGDQNKFAQQIRFFVLDKMPLSLKEIKEQKISFFPFVPTDTNVQNDDNFTKLNILSQRVRALVLNIKDKKIREALGSCMDRTYLLKHPSLLINSYPYEFMLTRGIENFMGGKKVKKSCRPYIGKIAKPLIFTSHHEESGSHEFIQKFLKQWSVRSNVPLSIEISNTNELIKRISAKTYDIAMIGIGPKSPLADGLFLEFAYGGTPRSVLGYSVKSVDHAYLKYTNATPDQISDAIREVEFTIRDEYLAIPIAVQTITFYLPKNWENLSLSTSSSGVFDLTNLQVMAR